MTENTHKCVELNGSDKDTVVHQVPIKIALSSFEKISVSKNDLMLDVKEVKITSLKTRDQSGGNPTNQHLMINLIHQF